MASKKTWQINSNKKPWESAQDNCQRQSGGGGVLGTILNAQEGDRLTQQLRSETPLGSDECWWIGLKRVGAVYYWDDGSEAWVAPIKNI